MHFNILVFQCGEEDFQHKRFRAGISLHGAMDDPDYYNYANEIMFDGTDMIGSGQVALYYNEVGTMTAYAMTSTIFSRSGQWQRPSENRKSWTATPKKFWS